VRGGQDEVEGSDDEGVWEDSRAYSVLAPGVGRSARETPWWSPTRWAWGPSLDFAQEIPYLEGSASAIFAMYVIEHHHVYYLPQAWYS
jgi:hypothetical protein